MGQQSGYRGVSESTGVAVLIILTVVATASVGMTVTLVMEDDTEFGAQFTFDHIEDLEQLLIFYDDGEPLRAGSVHIVGPDNEVTWAELEEMDPDEEIEPSNIPVQLGAGGDNAYGSSIGEDDLFEIRYVPEDEDDEEIVLAVWNDPADEEDPGDGLVDIPEN